MSETKRPFDAAIVWIREGVSSVHACNVYGKTAEALRSLDESIDNYRSAIRLLEAAGKVGKKQAIRVLATLLQRYVMGMGTIPELEEALKGGAVKEIRALLEALPEKED